MSYCRWSSDNWHCDLYVYFNGATYVTHVAGNHVVGDMPPATPLEVLTTDPERFAREAEEARAWRETAVRKPIGLSRDGQSFDDPDIPSLIERVESLRDEGYRVPAWLLPLLESEQ